MRTGAALGFLAVVMGAFGAHDLESILSTKASATYETAVRYHVYHALAILAVAAGSKRVWADPWSARACASWTVGAVVFSGSLYGLALSGAGWLGVLAPVGGAAMLAGWVCAFVAARSLSSDVPTT